MGNLRPKRGSSYILCLLVASTVVIVRLTSLCLCKAGFAHNALQSYTFIIKIHNFSSIFCHSFVLNPIYYNSLKRKKKENDLLVEYRDFHFWRFSEFLHYITVILIKPLTKRLSFANIRINYHLSKLFYVLFINAIFT